MNLTIIFKRSKYLENQEIYIEIITRDTSIMKWVIFLWEGSLFQSFEARNTGCIARKKVLRYLQKTKSYSPVYKRVKELEVEGYSDADFAGHFPDSRKSTSSYVFILSSDMRMRADPMHVPNEPPYVYFLYCFCVCVCVPLAVLKV